MKRKEAPTKDNSPSKKNKDASGQDIWPAPADQIGPDKDADGLSSGVNLHRTLVTLGLSPDLISVHLLEKGTTVHSEHERARLAYLSPSYLFVLDHGSRSSPPLVPSPCTTLIIDHHHSTPSDFPSDSTHVTACHFPPVATTSLLIYHITLPLSPVLEPLTSWLCIIGTHGDLGTTLKWLPPFPDMSAPLKLYTKKALNDAVSLLNAPRRTATYDVLSAWTALLTATHPKDISTSPRLAAARAEVNAEVERATHTAPKFSADGKVAVFRIRSACQVHPVIATRWAGHLNSKALEIVMGGEGKGPLLERLGDDFARGHVQASGGIVKVEEFEELMGLMRVGEKSEAQKKREEDKANGVSPTKGKVIDKGQTNTLMGYFGNKGGK
ncbi:hypothetical protein KVT40_005073 [Elsinoe batatas]|uniref:Uncharacterized protein n=1 Tax=Elsinoe batatas TaxID=2601811 RepID=A0A8K0L283_9PEZI|nr:hypothetical protein KVT40_005073 [Elsinoe batatas]